MSQIISRPPPGLGFSEPAASKKIRRNFIIIGDIAVYFTQNEICTFNLISQGTSKFILDHKLAEIIDIDINTELIAALDINGFLIVIKHRILQGDLLNFQTVGMTNSHFDQIYLCKMSNILYGACSIKYFVRFNSPGKNLSLNTKIQISKSFLIMDNANNMIFSISELPNFDPRILIFATSPSVLPPEESAFNIKIVDEIPYSIEFLQNQNLALAITNQKIYLVNCLNNEILGSANCQANEKPIICKVIDSPFTLYYAEGILRIIGHKQNFSENSEHTKLIRIKMLQKFDKQISTISTKLEPEKNTLTIFLWSDPTTCIEAQFLISNLKKILKLDSENAIIRDAINSYPKITNESFNKIIDEELTKVEDEIVGNLENEIDSKITGIINDEVEKNMKNIEDTICGNLPKYIENSIEKDKINNQITKMKENLQENLMFTIQNSFMPAYEENCKKLFKEMSKIHKDTYNIFKQKMDTEETSTKDLKLISEQQIKKNMELAEKFENVSLIQTDLSHRIEDLPKLMPDSQNIMQTPIKSVTPDKNISKPPNYFSKPKSPIPEQKPEIREFYEALQNANYVKTIEIMQKYNLSYEYLLKLLEKMDFTLLRKMRENGIFNQQYLREKSYEFVRNYQEKSIEINEKIIELALKIQEILDPEFEFFNEYKEVSSNLKDFIDFCTNLLNSQHN